MNKNEQKQAGLKTERGGIGVLGSSCYSASMAPKLQDISKGLGQCRFDNRLLNLAALVGM